MRLSTIELFNFRCFSRFKIKFGDEFNYLYGDNGCGKSSILESIYLVSRGKSFRSNDLSDIFHDFTSNAFEVRIGFRDSFDVERSLIFNKTKDKILVTYGFSRVTALSDLARLLPVLFINSDSIWSFRLSRIYRVKFFNWLLFHVKPKSHILIRDLNRILQQRNSALKTANIKLVKSFDNEYIEKTLELDYLLRGLVNEVNKLIALNACKYFNHLNIDYYPGWNDKFSFGDELNKKLPNELTRGYTLIGNHRSDYIIKCDNIGINNLSTGQNKFILLFLSYIFCQSIKYELDYSPILLIDDFDSDLSKVNLQYLLDLFETLDIQLILSTVDVDDVIYSRKQVKKFHVKQ